MKAREEMPLLRCALGPTGRPFGDGLHSVTASGTDGRKAVITRNWDMAGSTLKKPIRGRKMGVGAINNFNNSTFSTFLKINVIELPKLVQCIR
tara:strand:- start:414 stop:692 length:279 start_codon:yes stop_codon:yes gene_type:complete